MWTLACHRIESFRDSQYSRSKWDIRPMQTLWISAAVIAFLIRTNYLG